MIDQKPRDPLYPQGFEDVKKLKNSQIIKFSKNNKT